MQLPGDGANYGTQPHLTTELLSSLLIGIDMQAKQMLREDLIDNQLQLLEQLGGLLHRAGHVQLGGLLCSIFEIWTMQRRHSKYGPVGNPTVHSDDATEYVFDQLLQMATNMEREGMPELAALFRFPQSLNHPSVRDAGKSH